jgi:hypothetical protein
MNAVPPPERSSQAKTLFHMDGRWMWRFFVLDQQGEVIAASTTSYFDRADAEGAARTLVAERG